MIFVTAKIRIMEFHHPAPTNNFDDSPTHTIPPPPYFDAYLWKDVF